MKKSILALAFILGISCYAEAHNNQAKRAGASGAITGVTAGTNLNGGGAFGVVTLNLDDPFTVGEATVTVLWGSSVTAINANGLAFLDDSNTVVMFIEDGGQVGVGTINPAFALDVNGTGRFVGNFQTDSLTTIGDSPLDLFVFNPSSFTISDISYGINISTSIDGNPSLLRIDAINQYVGISSGIPTEALSIEGNIKANGRLYIQGSGASYILGRTGIGLIDPTARLEIQKTAADTWAVEISSENTAFMWGFHKNGALANVTLPTAGSQLDINNLLVVVNPYVGVGLVNPSHTLHVSDDFVVREATFVVSGGNVGIGITNPTESLYVVGNATFTGVVTGSTFNVVDSAYQFKGKTIYNNEGFDLGSGKVMTWADGVTQSSAGYSQGEIHDLLEGSNFEYFLYDNATDIVGYTQMVSTPSTESQAEVSASITTTDMIVSSFVTLSGTPGITELFQGIYDMHIHSSATISGKKGTQLYWKLYKRASGGAETLLGTSEKSGILTDTKTAYDFHISITDDIELLTSDRIVTVVYAYLIGSGGDPNLKIFFEGITASHITIRLASFSREHDGLANRDLSANHTQYLELNGNDSMAGILDMGTNLISNVVDPIDEQYAATKKYVDDATATVKAVAQGGTGASSLTDHGVLFGSGTSAVTVSTTGAAGDILTSGGAGADPTWEQASGDGGNKTRSVVFNAGGATFPNSNFGEPSKSTTTPLHIHAEHDEDTDETISFNWFVDTQLDETGTIDFRAVWDSTATTGDCALYVEVKSVAPGEDFKTVIASTNVYMIDAAGAFQAELNLASSLAVSNGDTAITSGDMLYLKLGRDANNSVDTMQADANIQEFILTYSVD